MVRQVESLGAELHRLFLTNLELTCEAHVDADTSGTLDVASTHVPIRTRCRSHQGSRVQVEIDTFAGTIGIGKNQVRPGVTVRRQTIHSGRYCQPTAGQYPDNS